jgi:hypothetical protein
VIGRGRIDPDVIVTRLYHRFGDDVAGSIIPVEDGNVAEASACDLSHSVPCLLQGVVTTLRRLERFWREAVDFGNRQSPER